MEKQIKIALAGNPNSGKTTLFNALTGSNQFVGNWPGVTVEKKEGKLKKHDDVAIMDLPGIYSLSPYTLEEVVARNYLITERPDAILNIIDGTNLERNLYLTTQLTELGIPVVIAINMMDVVRKNGDKINVDELSRELGCKIVEISALKGEGIMEAAEAAVQAAKSTKTVPMHTFSGPVEHAIAHIEEAAVHNLPEEQQRWYAIKIFERDDKVLDQLKIDPTVMAHIEEDIKAAEKELDDDAESIITNERYVYIAEIIKACYKKKNAGQMSASDKIDRIVTNRWLGLPIFAAVMFLVYYISMVTVGSAATDWANDGLFGDGWHLFGIGSKAYTEASDEYTAATQAVDAFLGLDTEAEDFDAGAALARIKSFVPTSDTATVDVEDEETLAVNTMTAYYDALPQDADKRDDVVQMTYVDAAAYLEANGFEAPDPADYGVWVPGVPVLVGNALESAGAADWLSGLILDGIVAGVGAVLGFVPQMLVLFLFLLPLFVQKNLGIELPGTLEIIILVFIFASEILGELGCFFINVPNWDSILHTTTGFLCAAFGFALIDILNRNDKIKFQLSPIYVALVAFCFSMTIGVLWEFFEFGMDRLFHMDMQKDTIVSSITSVMLDPTNRNIPITIDNITSVAVNGQDLGFNGYLDIGLYDTMEDLFVNFIGALTFSVFGYFYIKHRGKGRIAKAFIPTITENKKESDHAQSSEQAVEDRDS